MTTTTRGLAAALSTRSAGAAACPLAGWVLMTVSFYQSRRDLATLPAGCKFDRPRAVMLRIPAVSLSPTGV